MTTTDATKNNISSPENITLNAHGCEIIISGDKITVRDGVEEITGTYDNGEWQIKTFILGQIHGILEEYTPATLIDTARKYANKTPGDK